MSMKTEARAAQASAAMNSPKRTVIPSEAQPPDCHPLTPFLSVRARLQWWIKHGAPQQVLDWIERGVPSNWPSPQLPFVPHRRGLGQESLIKDILQEYLDIGAVTPSQQGLAKYLVPWFVLEKQEG